MQISHEIFSRKFPSSLLIFRKRLFKNENLGDYFRNFMVSPAHNYRLSLSSSLSSSSSSLGKRHLKSEFPLPQTLSRLFHLVQFVKCWYFFLELTKREIRYFHVAVVRWRKRNVQKSVIHVHSCCFANLNLLLFCRSRWRLHRRCLSSLLPLCCRRRHLHRHRHRHRGRGRRRHCHRHRRRRHCCRHRHHHHHRRRCRNHFFSFITMIVVVTFVMSFILNVSCTLL